MFERLRNCFGDKRRDRTGERRTVLLGDADTRRRHPSNEVKSSKYNLATFLPLNLWEQFHRPINVYFLLIAGLQFIPNVAPVSPYTTIFPITIAFMTNTVKEGIDDFHRHRQDRESNSRRYTILDPTTRRWKEVASKDIHVGDVVMLRPFEIVPSDVVVLMSSGEGGEAYISTESLDGETGTKARLAVLRDAYDPRLMAARHPLTTQPPTNRGSDTRASQAPVHPPVAVDELHEAVEFLNSTALAVDSEGPNPFLHTYNATVTISIADAAHPPSSHGTRRRRRGGDGTAAAFPRADSSTNSFSSSDEREALLSVSATDTQHNSRRPTVRKSLGVTAENVVFASSVTRNTRCILGVVVFTGMETKVAMTRGAPPTKWATIDDKFNYMTTAIFVLQFCLLVLYSYLSISSLYEHRFWYLGGWQVEIPQSEYFPILPLRYFTMLSPMVPLSFKVMVELSKAYISSVIRWDDGIRDGDSGEPATVNNSALAEDLGQVEYVLSDKTGTLTANTMTLAAVATAEGTVYASDEVHAKALKVRLTTELSDLAETVQTAVGLCALLAAMTFCNTIERSLLAGAVAPPQSRRDARRRRRQHHPAPAPEKTWMSCSPDEVALVEGVELCGVTLLERTRKASRACFWDHTVCVDIVKVIPFTSERGRMSVLVRRHAMDGVPAGGVLGNDTAAEDYVLLMKGSDEKVFPLCGADTVRLDGVPEDAEPSALLERFSQRGLRTLVYAYRQVSADEATAWLTAMEQAEATVTAEERESRVREGWAKVERDMTYCGCTAVEDQLQERVAETISQVRNANIRVWMLTGDRAETARQTAVASGLLTSEDRLFSLTPPTPSDASEPASPAHERRSTASLHHIRSMVQQLLQSESVLQPAEITGTESSFLHRLYVGSGMQDYVKEFLSPFSSEHLKPLNHPLKYANPDPELYPTDVVARLTSSASSVAQPEEGSSPAHVGTRRGGYSLLISGSTIGAVFESGDHVLQRDFSRVLLEANTVVCSRTAPDQKARIVRMVKAAGKVTLAIGDGGNDVSMIQAAHVGVGIKGKEGNQAALSSDFAIGQFRFLARLLLVHGHTAYQRTAVIVQQSFWKSVLIAWVQLLFNVFTDFSGISYWDSFCLVLYNAIPTVPVTFLCVMDVPLSPWMLERNPQLYRMSQRGRYLNSVTFYGYIARAVLHGTLCFFLATAINHGSGALLSTSGRTMDRSGDFYAAYFAVVTVHTYTVLTESHSINFAHWQCFLFSVWSCFLCFWLFAASPTSSNPTFRTLLVDPGFYLAYAIITTVICYSQGLFASIKAMWFPDVLQLQRTAALYARSTAAATSLATSTGQAVGPLLQALFEDDNPSVFWRSWSPIHAIHRFGPRVVSAADVRESSNVPSRHGSTLSGHSV